MTLRRWLAAAAGMALLAGVPVDGVAAARVKASVKVKKAKRPVRRVVHRRPRVAAVVPVVAPPVILLPSPPVYVEPPVIEAPAPSYAAYRWLDDADAMLGAIAGTPPDRVFAIARDARFAWLFADGGVVIAEPLNPFERRWYFFERDVTVPFLVRDVGRSFAFDRGRLTAVYDANGGLRDGRPGDREKGEAMALLDRGRRLWFAARDPRPLPPREQLSGWSLRDDFGDPYGWRQNGGWRAYRGGGDDRRQARDDRYRREREERRARGGVRAGNWSPQAVDGVRTGRRPNDAARPTAPNGAPPRAADQPGAATSEPARGPGAVERVRTEPRRDRAERRDDRPLAEAPRRPADAAPAPERTGRRDVEAQAAPSPRIEPPAPAPERAPPPRREPEPVAPPPLEQAAPSPRIEPPAPEPERAPPPPREPEPVAPSAPPPQQAAPPPEPERQPDRPPVRRQAEPENAEKPE